MTHYFATSIVSYLMIPLSAGIIGWATNVLAIKMMFQPLEFMGKKPYFGWQGIIPSKAHKLASNVVEMVLTRLISIEEMFKRIDPKRVASEISPVLDKMAENIVSDVVSESYPKVWDSLPQKLKDKTFERVQKEIPGVVEEIVKDIEMNIEEICDIRSIVIDAFVQNKSLLNELFLRCGAKEFKFIGHSGLYFGSLFGLIQMGVWIYYPKWWLLPAAGLVVGYITNWLALKMVFEPVQPVTIGPISWQGLFLRRQKEVSAEYAQVFANEVLNAKALLNGILRGPASDRLFMIIQRHLKRTIDESSGVAKPFVQLVIGTDRYVEMKEKICDRLMEKIPDQISRLHTYTDEALAVQDELETKLQELSAEDFEGILHPIFQEDEWILILVGALLGMAAGFGQLFFLG